jgi:hypothetical protein
VNWRLSRFALTLAVAFAVSAACAPTKKGPPHPRILLVGDSIAEGFASSLQGAVGGRPFESAAIRGCGILRGRIADFQGTEVPWAEACDAVTWGRHEEFLDRFQPDIVVWLSIIEIQPRRVDGDLYTPTGPNLSGPGIAGTAGDAKILELMDEAWGHLTSHGARLVVLTMPPPESPFEDAKDERTEWLNVLLKTFASRHPENTRLIDLAAIACPPAGETPCPVVVDGIRIRLDVTRVHFSPEGAAWAAARVGPLIAGG